MDAVAVRGAKWGAGAEVGKGARVLARVQSHQLLMDALRTLAVSGKRWWSIDWLSSQAKPFEARDRPLRSTFGPDLPAARRSRPCRASPAAEVAVLALQYSSQPSFRLTQVCDGGPVLARPRWVAPLSGPRPDRRSAARIGAAPQRSANYGSKPSPAPSGRRCIVLILPQPRA